MNRDEIIRMAREAGITMEDENTGEYSAFDQELERFAELVAAAEREECAKVCDGRKQEGLSMDGCATSIRAMRNA